MSEMIDNNSNRRKELQKIVADLNSDADVAKVKKRFDKLIRDVSPEEIAAMEQDLIAGGVPVEHVQKLCEVHVSVFESALKKQPEGKALSGHPVATYRAENQELRKLLRTTGKAARKACRTGSFEDLTMLAAQLKKVEIHYQRKENQLFPYLESVGFTGPSKVMWGKHDENRALLKVFSASIEQRDNRGIRTGFSRLAVALRRMIFMEERILFPTALRKLPDTSWARIRKGESSIGYAWTSPGNLWDPDIILASRPESSGQVFPQEPSTTGPAAYAAAAGIPEKNEGLSRNGSPAAHDRIVRLDVGELTPTQIDLMLKHLPIDITYVDEHDTVRYYSQGRERHFPRSPGIIGRSVQNCHPPKSVHIVEQIVASFRNREKERADFWIRMGEKLLYIRYFPIFDDQDLYRGVVEVTQEISEIQALEGEKRLLDWQLRL